MNKRKILSCFSLILYHYSSNRVRVTIFFLLAIETISSSGSGGSRRSLVVAATNESQTQSTRIGGSHQFRLSQSDHLAYIRDSKSSFKNKTLVVSIVVREPFVIFNEPPGWHSLSTGVQQSAREDLDNYGGVAIEVVKRLKSIFGFSTRLTSPADNQFGTYSPETGTWNGLMGQLVLAEVDIGVTALSLTMARG